MPIGGFVVNAQPEFVAEVAKQVAAIADVEVHGFDADGNIVAVIDTVSSIEMEAHVKEIEAIAAVLTVGAAYLHAEDEIDKIISGELIIDKPFHQRQRH
ncbi:MAG: chaperone NapD [Desulfuromonas sp.]|nr:chaperone NapD [Desulfuromonas sp.]